MSECKGQDILPAGLKTVLSEDGVKVNVYYLECLAQASYLIHHEGVALLVDPRRDVDAYVNVLESEGLILKGILETHFHADFVSGHYELMQRTGAPVYFGPGAKDRTKFAIHEVKDSEVIEFTSRFSIQVLHTPGHTPESVVYLLYDKLKDKPLQAYTGDTLFIGSCGRPDLVGSIGFTAEGMARLMFKSLTTKVSTLPDHVQVFPAHGAGSPCGKNLSDKLYSTIGDEKKTNPALSFTDEDAFVAFLTRDQPEAPQYFAHDVQLNIEGAPPLAQELSRIPQLSVEEFKQLSEEKGYTVLDTRSQTTHLSGHIPGSLNFSLGCELGGGTIVGPEDGNFALWVGTLIRHDTHILLVNSCHRDSEAKQRLSRIGYATNIKGVLSGGFEAYKKAGLPVASNERVNLESGPGLGAYLTAGVQVIDVRTSGEFDGDTVRGAINVPLANIRAVMNSLDKQKKYIAFCVSGYRSAIASSVLRQAGFDSTDVDFGFASISMYSPDCTTSGKICPKMKALIEMKRNK